MKPDYRKLRGCLAVFLIAFLSYLPALRGDFHFDDFHHIVANPAVQSPRGWFYFFTHPESFSSLGRPTLYRPLTLISFAVSYQISGEHAWPWLLVNVLLHAFNAALFFLLLLKWRRDYVSALFGSGLFAVMAVLSQPVNYLSSRATLLAVFFILLGLIFDWPEEESGKRSAIKLIAAAAFFWLALFCKEIAAVFPALVLIEDWFLAGRKKSRFRIIAHSLYWASLGIFLWLRWIMFDTVGSSFYPRPILNNLLTQAKAVFFYLARIFWPIHLSVIPELKLGQSLAEPGVFAAVSAIAVISLALLVYGKRAKLASFVWFWFLLSLLPAAALPLNVVVSEDRVYLPSLGIVLLLAAVFEQARQNRSLRLKRAAYICFLLIFVFNLELLERRIPAWRTELSLWRDAVAKSPHLGACYIMYAQALLDKNKLGRALDFYNRGLAINPRNPGVFSGLCRLYLARGDPEAAISAARQYEQTALHPVQKAEAYAYRSMAEFQMSLFDQAEKDALASLAIDPRQDQALYVLGAISKSRGDKDPAEKYARESLLLNPKSAKARSLLALILAERGDVDEAIANFKQAALASPDDHSLWLNLGMAYLAGGDLDNAEAALKKALHLNQKYALGHYGMALLDYSKKNSSGSLSELDQALEIDPGLAQAHFLKARILIDQLKQGPLTTEPAKKEIRKAINQEMKWLKGRKIDTGELEEKLRSIGQ